ncbi:uncharacterized protein N7506_012027 [Penicillium brevicompactum]|uniref:uncharacterized protein n=1 Tax=Penicillium brevicompactum TaxID=5074 RepID=UPI0025423FB2|nr:uncharacterized protein N7506_012027 [Penicillium brevicompactum]KAJ5319323.1 hypothetical protein N7506_012027 [Penicillium brevicompactum]
MASQQEESGPKTQLHRLPTEIDYFEIENVTILEKDTGFKDWRLMIICSLLPFGCHNLIRSDMPRPKPADTSYMVWYYYSAFVGQWLYNQVSDSIRSELVVARMTWKDGFFADVVMERIEKIVLGNGRVGSILVNNIHNFWSINRNQYDSAIDYINDFYAQMDLLHELKVPIPWIVALGKILQELTDELPSAVFLEDRIRDMSPEEITEEKFLELCESLRFAARHQDTWSKKAANSDDSEANADRNNNSNNKKKKNRKKKKKKTKDRMP